MCFSPRMVFARGVFLSMGSARSSERLPVLVLQGWSIRMVFAPLLLAPLVPGCPRNLLCLLAALGRDKIKNPGNTGGLMYGCTSVRKSLSTDKALAQLKKLNRNSLG